jgi:Zn-dependent protease with chaperone function
MPILLILSVAAACLPLPWPAPPAGIGPSGSLALTAAVTLAPVLAAGILSNWVVRTLRRRPESRSAVLATYSQLRRILGLVSLVAAAGAVIGLGWGWTVWHSWFLVTVGHHPEPQLVPAAELLVPAPYFLALVLCWTVYYPAELALHRTSSRADGPHGFWTRAGYVLFHLRQFALMIGLPVGLCVAQQGLVRVVPEVARADWFQVVSVAAAVGLFVVLPRLVKPALGLRSLPSGPVRDRLEATARRLGVRATDLLVWPTHGAMANAMVIGVVPWARYVIFTDRLLEGLSPDELDAVFGHEAGHVRHRHIPYYAAFLILSATVASTALMLLAQEFDLARWEREQPVWAEWLPLPPLLMTGAYIFLVFGLLSRRCERQADVYGCRAGSCADPGCLGHGEETVLVPRGRGLCRTGAMALVRALDRVAELNGMDGRGGRSAGRGVMGRVWSWLRAWQHGPVADRIEFLLRLSEDPSLGDRVDRRVTLFRRALAVLLVAALVVLGSYVGWAELWRML